RRQRAFEFVDGGADLLVERQRGDGQSARAVDIRKRDGFRLEVGVEDGAAADLVPVMVLGIDPEDRDRRHAVFGGGSPGELQRGDGLEQRQKRAAEHARLLAGDDRHAVWALKEGRGLAGFGWSPSPLLLGRNHGGDAVTVSPVLLRPRNRGLPRVARGWIAVVQRRDAREIRGVLAGEWPDPRETLDVD